MSLLQCLPFQIYNELIQRKDGWAFRVAEVKNIRNVPETDTAIFVINTLDRRGYSLSRFYRLLDECKVRRQDDTNHLPKVKETVATLKVAILIGNAIYEHWHNLVTPTYDCRELGDILKSMGFLVIILENISSEQFRESIEKLCAAVPSKSYLLIYFAGHGFEVFNAKYMLGTECPAEQLTLQNGVSESFITKHAFGCKPELVILLLDMCRKPPDREQNPGIYSNMPTTEEFSKMYNLIVGYATSPYMPALEQFGYSSTMSQSQHISCCQMRDVHRPSSSTTQILTESCDDDTEDVKPFDKEKRMKGISLYIHHLTSHLRKNEDFVRILEMVHKDFGKEQNEKASSQKPQKWDNVATTFFLTHKHKGDAVAEENISRTVDYLRSKNVSICLKKLELSE